MIKIENLTFSFADHRVLNDISIDFKPNQVYGIVGLNGAGKTTFFNVLSTNLKIETGHISFNDSKITNKDIAYLETVNYFYSRITGNEYLKIFKQTNPDFNLESLQEFMKLPLNDLIETYSTGMKKKLALLGVLKQDKPIFLLDEPFNGLDLETNKILELIIVALMEKGKTVFVSSHIIEPLLNVCQRIHHLENGKFIKSYDKNDFHHIEDELFKKLKTEAKTIISRSL
jgi:ABC-2 type transport system ATP-binding protein